MTPATYKARAELLRQKHVFMRDHALNTELLPGWLFILERLCSEIEKVLSQSEKLTLRVIQIKEKLGELAFYSSFITDSPIGSESPADFSDNPRIRRYFELVETARRLSLRTCFMCSEAGELREVRDTYLTLCPIHRNTHFRHLDFAFEQVTTKIFVPPTTVQIATRLGQHVERLRALGFTELAIAPSSDALQIYRLVSRDPTSLTRDSALLTSVLARWPLDPAIQLTIGDDVVWVFQDE